MFRRVAVALRGRKIKADEQVVIFNTGSGIKYLECYED